MLQSDQVVDCAERCNIVSLIIGARHGLNHIKRNIRCRCVGGLLQIQNILRIVRFKIRVVAVIDIIGAIRCQIANRLSLYAKICYGFTICQIRIIAKNQPCILLDIPNIVEILNSNQPWAYLCAISGNICRYSTNRIQCGLKLRSRNIVIQRWSRCITLRACDC